MMYYCKGCKQFFRHPVTVPVSELHTEVDTRQCEDYTEERCPYCSSDYLEMADTCAMCGKNLPQGTGLCMDCVRLLGKGLAIVTILGDVSIESAKDGMAEFLNMEEN